MYIFPLLKSMNKDKNKVDERVDLILKRHIFITILLFMSKYYSIMR